MKRSRWARHRVAVLTCTGALVSGLILPVLATTAAAAPAGGLGPPNTFVATGPLGVAQSGQTATRLPDGDVLIAAGGTTNAELYNPRTRRFTPAAKMPVAVSGATATLLPNGKVLVAGGVHRFHQVTNTELYDPATGTWRALSGVNITLGLPVIRTSVDHGTAFDIAGKGIANEESLIEAIDYAERLAARRRTAI